MLRRMIVHRPLGQMRGYVHDPFQSTKPSSETHATEKTDKRLNVQSDAVDKGMKDKQQATERQSGDKQTPEKKTKAPGPVIGMQDERGGVNE